MGSSASAPESSKNSETSQTSAKMDKLATHHKVIPTSEPKLQKPLKGILKNKCAMKVEKPVKVVELYVLRESKWTVTRVTEDELEMRKKELKCDKTVKRIYSKPTQDQTFLHFQPF